MRQRNLSWGMKPMTFRILTVGYCNRWTTILQEVHILRSHMVHVKMHVIVLNGVKISRVL